MVVGNFGDLVELGQMNLLVGLSGWKEACSSSKQWGNEVLMCTESIGTKS